VKRFGLGAGLLAFAGACRGEDWVIASARSGEAERRDEPGDASSALVTVRPECATASELLAERAELYGPAELDARHTGVWRGLISGSAAVGFPSARVELSLEPGGLGHLTFVGSPLPEADDPDRGYLCSASTGGFACGTRSGFVGGFAYSLERIISRGDVLSFVVVENDPWGVWCSLRRPLRWADEALACGYGFGVQLPGSDTEGSQGCGRVSADGESTPVDCELMYTLRHCQCGADACFSSFATGIDVGLELGGGGNLLRGSIWYSGDADAALVELDRQRDSP
jgi:hypothetical protein